MPEEKKPSPFDPAVTQPKPPPPPAEPKLNVEEVKDKKVEVDEKKIEAEYKAAKAKNEARRKEILEIAAITIKEHGGLESNIGRDHEYWQLMNEYRGLLHKQ